MNGSIDVCEENIEIKTPKVEVAGEGIMKSAYIQ